MSGILEFDRNISLAINSFHSEWADFVMYWLSDKIIWIPLYLFLIGLLVYKYKKSVWIWVIALALIILIADQSCNIFKMTFERFRPCQDASMQPHLHLLDGICHGKYGFTSSHAANSFAIATFVSLTLGRYFKVLKWIMFVWAAVIAYSRVYLAAHFFGDVVCGALLGAIIAFAIVKSAFWLRPALKTKT
jgi:undecaprenyl-diphosphatase